MGLPDEKPTRLYLIRHGEVENSRQGKYNGHSDVELSAVGIQQFQILSERLSKEPVVSVYSSDLVRTRTGAEMIAKPFGLRVQVRKDLREKNFGNWEGLTPEQVSKQFPKDWKQWLINPVDFSHLGGESYRNVFKRAVNVLTEILENNRQQEVVIVSHGGVNRLILSYALHLDLKNINRIEQKYGALNVVDFYKDVGVIKLINGLW